MKVRITAIEKVIPYARNPRRNQGAIAKVAASIKEFGWQQPIVVDNEMVVIAGHTRLAAAQSLGMSEVPIVIADNLTPAQAKAYRLADNRVSQEAEWDHDLLTLELQDLLDEEYNLDWIGFDEEELSNFFQNETNNEEKKYDLSEQEDLEPTFEVAVECENEEQQRKIYEYLTNEGYKCRVLSI